ncbi:hypothetical protein ACIRL3_40600 [Streptomyces sp. NPDC102384]|uniref:hypothetical protein n=1 Tax=Streptomyces sp. NPDC102384 TaxID=3366166 RepID=UPI0037F2F55B
MSNLAAQLAQDAAESIRSFNHFTQPYKGELTYPSEAYEAVGSLVMLTQRLPQSYDQLSTFLERVGKTGAVTADHGTPDEHLAEARSALASAALIAQTLTEHLERAHNALSPLGLRITDEH